MESPNIRVSFDVRASLVLGVLVVVAFHIYRPLDFSRSPVAGAVYWSLWMVLAAAMGRIYYGAAHTVVSASGVVCFTLFRRESLQWCEVAKAEVLKNGNIALWTTTQRVVVPLASLTYRAQLSEFIIARIREVGAPIHQEH